MDSSVCITFQQWPTLSIDGHPLVPSCRRRRRSDSIAIAHSAMPLFRWSIGASVSSSARHPYPFHPFLALDTPPASILDLLSRISSRFHAYLQCTIRVRIEPVDSSLRGVIPYQVPTAPPKALDLVEFAAKSDMFVA